MHAYDAFPLFIYPLALPTQNLSPSQSYKISAFYIEQIVMERAYNKIRYMPQ